jgi:hypothetical protein
MATKPYETIMTRSTAVTLVKWANLANGDDGAPYIGPHAGDRTVKVLGTFGAGGMAVIEGGMDPTEASPDYDTLTDPNGNALTFTVKRTEAILEVTPLIRPRVPAGDGTTNLTVYLLVLRTTR